jgi:2-methylcitrate dehydratase PrpD
MSARHAAKEMVAYTDELSSYVANLEYGDLPEFVVQQAKMVVLDTIGVLIAASAPHYKATEAVVELARQLGGGQESTVIGTDLRTSCVNAVLANATMADNIELDDSHPLSAAHVAAVIIPTALALSERQGANGRVLLTSVVLGYDVDVRVVLATNPSSMYDRGFHPSTVGGCFGATAVAARILELSESETTHALGLAGCQACGLMAWENDPTQMPKSLQMGIAARNGVTAALLANLGFSGPPSILEGTYGVLGAFSDEPHPRELGADLRERFEITLTGLKKYACCRFLHASLDAFLKVVHDQSLQIEDIERVVVRVPESGAPIIDGNDLLSHSAQYIIPLAARDRTILPEHIYQDHRSDPSIAQLMPHVEVLGDGELSRVFPGRFSEPAVVQVYTRHGGMFAERSDYASGDPEKPLTQEELNSKFMALATTRLPSKAAARIMRIVHQLEDAEDVRELMALLRL